MLNPDFRDMLSALSDAGAEFLVVGAYALAAHGLPRSTGDLDIWVNATVENARKVWTALETFGTTPPSSTLEDLSAPGIVLQIGVAPRRIDLLSSIEGVDFEAAQRARIVIEIEGLQIPVLSREHLIANKRAVGRPQDLADVARLEFPEN